MIVPSIYSSFLAFLAFFSFVLTKLLHFIIVAGLVRALCATAWKSYLKVSALGAQGGQGQLWLCRMTGTMFNPRRRFQTRGTPRIMPLKRTLNCKRSIFGYHHFRNPPKPRT